MKKLTALLLAILIVFSIVGCSSGTTGTTATSPSASASESVSPESASPSSEPSATPSLTPSPSADVTPSAEPSASVSPSTSPSPAVSPSASTKPTAAPAPAVSQKPAAATTAPANAPTVELTISAAASLTQPMNVLINNYKKIAPNVKITANYGASGTLQTQIENGAPADLFFSAATKQMEALVSKDLIVTSTKANLLKNEIVLIVPVNSTLGITGFGDINKDFVKSIALGDPKSVPAGQYAQDTFKYIGNWDKVTPKAMYGTDVKQVLSWVSSGNADCGVVYKTDAISDKGVKIIQEAPSVSHIPVVYPAAVVKSSTHQTEATAFLNYLKSADAMKVFVDYGFMKY